VITIISPEQFKTIPWKNGKGVTTELAISDGGTLEKFDWRLSIANVVENGVFSDFSGYLRNLVLIEGEGIELEHDNKKRDVLSSLLSFATFDGACKTVGTLNNGAIKDLNIMVDVEKYKVKVDTYLKQQTVELEHCELCFVFALTGQSLLKSKVQITEESNVKEMLFEENNLLKISPIKSANMSVSGEQLIVVHLSQR